MADPILPPVPTAPTGADAQQWRDYIAHVQAYNYAVSIEDARQRAASAEKHAQAQADTATAMDNAAAAQREAIAALMQPGTGVNLQDLVAAAQALKQIKDALA